MAITKLTNTQIQNIVNEAYRQFTGQDGTDVTLDLSQFADTGVSDVSALRSRFTGKLLGSVVNFYTQTAYAEQYKDVFYENEDQFNGILQAISVDVPAVKENSAWKDFVSGTTQVGVYTVYLPIVNTEYFTKTESYALPITITGEQWDSAFKDQNGLDRFVEYLFMCVSNAIIQHREDMNASNRNNFMAEKIRVARQEADGIHAVNIVEAYCKDAGISAMTVEEFNNSDAALKFSIEQTSLYIDYMQRQNVLFNVGGKVRFVPRDELVVQMLSSFEKKLFTVALSDTFHDDLVALPLHESVACWQSLNDLSFEGLSSINIKCASGDTIEQSGIVAFIASKKACMHTIKKQRVASQYFPIEDVTHYEYQFRDAYINMLDMPAVVLFVADYDAEATE